MPGRLLKEEGGISRYQTDAGVVEVPATEQLEQLGDAKVLAGVNDICSLDTITAATLLHSVRVRYARDDIYTNISRILVAVNPFKPLSIYEDQYVELYHAAPDPAALPPHVFGVGADVFQRLTADSTSQAVLISGESGAGKTESTKLMLLYISQAFNADSEGDGFEDKILEINPILEAFGNAKTGRNNNSSRFGKWIEVLVDPLSMRLRGASVTDYLLEVTRVCSQGPGERNYHVFYQLVNDQSSDLEDLKLSGGVEGFAYLKQNPGEVSEINDSENFDMLRKAFAGLGFSKDEQEAVFRIVAGILHLGNVTFEPSPDRAKVADAAVLADAAGLLGCKPADLTQCVCNKRLVVGKDVTLKPLGDESACRARDSIAKMIYSRLFKWLVERCNQALGAQLQLDDGGAAAGKSFPFIGVLDIAGFESFETNSLEQLFINLSNEKLQQFFNSYVFKTELNEYSAEGIQVDKIDFADNAEILTLVEGKGGLLPMLDDSTTGIKQTDATYTTQVVKAHEKNPRFVKPKFPNQPLFTIRHFAGDVVYTTEGFLEKNVAQQPPEVLEMMASSELPVLKELAVEPEAAGGATRGVRKATVGSAFRKSLQQLIDKFGEAGAHFIRCVKPNTQKVPERFESTMVIEQLRLSGVMEAVKIRKAGFPLRQATGDFVKRYAVILPRTLRANVLGDKAHDGEITAEAVKALLEALVEMLESKIQEADYAIGKTKVFMRDSLYRTLEKYRRLALAGPALQIQQIYRGHRLRTVMREVVEVYGQLQKLLENAGLMGGQEPTQGSVLERQQRATVMEDSLRQLDVLLTRAEGLSVKPPVLQRMLRARARVAAEASIARQMQTLVASTSVDMPAIEAVLARSADYRMAGAVVDSLRERCAKLREQLPLSRALRSCADLDLEGVRARVEEAKQKGFDVPENWILPVGPQLYKDALDRLAQLEEEEKKAAEDAARKAAEEAAAAAAQKEARQKAAMQAAELAAAQTRARLKKRIEKAVAEFDAEGLQDALHSAEECGMPEAEVAGAHKLFLDMQSGEFVQQQLAKQRRAGGVEPIDLLVKSNLIKQIEVLGLKVMPRSEEMREVTNEIVARQRQLTFDTTDQLQTLVAERCFEDLANFSGLRDPQSWGPRGYKAGGVVESLAAGRPGVPAMLQWSPDRLPETLTVLDAKLTHMALRNFANLLRCMGDKPSAYIGNKEEPILSLARREPALRDEIYLQVLKQLTGNPSAESAQKGWRLLQALCHTAPPAAELAQFLRAFLRRAEKAGEAPQSKRPSRVLRQASSSLAEQRRKSFPQLMKAFLAEQPRLAAEVLAALEASQGAAAAGPGPAQGSELVEVHTEDGMSRPIKVKKGTTLAQLHTRMLKVMSLLSADAFEFFTHDPEEPGPPWRLLPRSLTVDDAVARTNAAGRCLLFGRMNLTPGEDLCVDDLNNARLTHLHAVKQFLGYSLPLPGGKANAEIWVRIAAALVSADRATYGGKKRRGKGHDRFNAKVAQLKAELDGGLAGASVLERYVPAAQLKAFGREALASQVMAWLQRPSGHVNEDGSFELMSKGRALALMQANLPDFGAYACGTAAKVQDEVRWNEIKWIHVPPRPPKQELEMHGMRQAEYQLLVSGEGLELQTGSALGWGVRIPFRQGLGRCHLTGWGAPSSDTLALSLMETDNWGDLAPAGLVLRMPEGAPEATCALLFYFNR